eukprot:3300149-Karenia_brevis.AAC.1
MIAVRMSFGLLIGHWRSLGSPEAASGGKGCGMCSRRRNLCLTLERAGHNPPELDTDYVDENTFHNPCLHWQPLASQVDRR